MIRERNMARNACLTAAAVMTAATTYAKLPPVDQVELEGAYNGHLQDVWYDGKDSLYWAHTEVLLKTDLQGKVLKRKDVVGHHAGIEEKDGRLYVAVCPMQDRTGGRTTADCRVAVGEYDAQSLDLIAMHTTDIHDRAGSLAILEDGTFIVGCLRPDDITKSQVRFHHLDRNFKLIKSHVVDNCPVKLGIEVIKRRGSDLILNMYGPPGMVRLNKDWREVERGELGGACGLVLDGNDVWNGKTNHDPNTKQWRSKLVRMKDTKWKLLPINGGGFIQNVQIAPSDPKVWYTYVDVGGPYRSDDAGENWYPLHQNMPQTMRNCWADHVRTLLVDPRNAKRIVFAAGWHTERNPAGIYTSKDGGKTFQRVVVAAFHGEGGGYTKVAGKVIARDPGNPDMMLAASDGNGIFLSKDGGDSWTSCGVDGCWFTEVAFDKTVPKRAYASAPLVSEKAEESKRYGFFRSEDGGKTWTKISETAPAEIAQIAGRKELIGTFHSITEGDEIRISEDGGATWRAFAEGLPKATEKDPYQGRYQCIAAGKDYYLTFNWSGRMFRRQAGSEKWVEIPIESMTMSHPEKENGVERSVARKCRECTSDIMIDPKDENHIMTTDWFHIWESLDGGKNWRTRTNGIQQLVPFTLACDPNSPENIAYGCADMGMFCTTNGGNTYRKEHGICGANSIAWAYKAKHRGYAVGGKHGIQLMITENGGAKWRYSKYAGLPALGQKDGKHGIYTIAVDPTTDYVYVCLSGEVKKGKGGIYRSTDGGDTWTWFGDGLSETPQYYKESEFSHGGPALWPEQLVFGPDGSAITYGPKTGKMFYLNREAGRWEHLNVWCKGGAFTLAADPHQPGRFLLATADHITEILEGGRKVNWWLPGSQGLGYAVAFDPFTPGLVVSATADAEDVCVSKDSGRHWTCLPKGMQVPTGTQHKLVVDRKRLYILTRGSGVWTRTLD